MQPKGIAVGFIAGLAVAGGAFLLLRNDNQRAQEAMQVGELKLQVDRLERALTELQAMAKAPPQVAATDAPSRKVATSPTLTTSADRNPDQARAIAEAESLVEQGLQSGHWSMEQASELSLAVADLDVKEQGRILARVSAAINAGQMRFDPPR